MPQTAIVTAKLSWKDRIRYGLKGTPIIVDHPGDYPDSYPDAHVKARTIEIYRPPTTLTLDGHAQAGISKELFAHYLISVVEQAMGTNIDADVEFGETAGRFATVHMTLRAWGQTLTFMIPIGLISRQIKEALDLYMAGLGLKVGQAHRGHQDHTQANRLFDEAFRRFTALRDAHIPHYHTDAEFMFVTAQCRKAQRTSPLATLPDTERIIDRTPTTGWQPDLPKKEPR